MNKSMIFLLGSLISFSSVLAMDPYYTEEIQANLLKDVDPPTMTQKLQRATLEGNAYLVRKLVEEGANTSEQNIDGQIPLHYESQKPFPNVQIVRLLLNKDTVNTPNNYGNTPVHLAAISSRDYDPENNDYDPENKIKILKLMIEMGADLNAVNKDGKKPIDFAEHSKVKALLQKAMDNQKPSARN